MVENCLILIELLQDHLEPYSTGLSLTLSCLTPFILKFVTSFLILNLDFIVFEDFMGCDCGLSRALLIDKSLMPIKKRLQQ